MAYIDVDKDIRYYTDRLEEKIDELEIIVKALDDFEFAEGFEIMMNDSWVGEEHSEDGSIRQDIKDLTEKVNSMYEAITSMVKLSATHKQLTDTLEERIIILEE